MIMDATIRWADLVQLVILLVALIGGYARIQQRLALLESKVGDLWDAYTADLRSRS